MVAGRASLGLPVSRLPIAPASFDRFYLLQSMASKFLRNSSEKIFRGTSPFPF